MRNAIEQLRLFVDKNPNIAAIIAKLEAFSEGSTQEFDTLRNQLRVLLNETQYFSTQVNNHTLAEAAYLAFSTLGAQDILLAAGLSFTLNEVMQFNHTRFVLSADDHLNSNPISILLHPHTHQPLDPQTITQIRHLAKIVNKEEYELGKAIVEMKDADVELFEQGKALLETAASLGHVDAANILTNIYLDLKTYVQLSRNQFAGVCNLEIALQLNDQEARLKYAGFLLNKHTSYIKKNVKLSLKILDDLIKENYLDAIQIKSSLFMEQNDLLPFSRVNRKFEAYAKKINHNYTDHLQEIQRYSQRGSIAATQILFEHYTNQNDAAMTDFYYDLYVSLPLETYRPIFTLLLQASNLGGGKSSFLLAELYLNGNNNFMKDFIIEPDIDKGMSYLHKSLEQGNAEAGCVLAEIYLKQQPISLLSLEAEKKILQSVPYNYEKAREVLEKALSLTEEKTLHYTENEEDIQETLQKCRSMLDNLPKQYDHRGPLKLKQKAAPFYFFPETAITQTVVTSPQNIFSSSINECMQNTADLINVNVEFLHAHWNAPSGIEFGLGHREALLYFVVNKFQEASQAIRQINGLSSEQAFYLPELSSYNVDADHLRQWRPATGKSLTDFSEHHTNALIYLIQQNYSPITAIKEISGMTSEAAQHFQKLPSRLIQRTPNFTSEHDDALMSLIKNFLCDPQEAYQQISILTAQRAMALSILYPLGFRGHHLLAWKPHTNEISADFTDVHIKAVIVIIGADKRKINADIRAADAIQNLTELSREEVEQLIERCANNYAGFFSQQQPRYVESCTTESFTIPRSRS